MSYTVVPEGRAPRPAVVSAAAALMYVAAAALLIQAAVAFVSVGPTIDVLNDAYKGTEMADAAATVAWIGVGVSAGLYVLFAIALSVLAIFVGKGKQPARITTWVVGGLVALCCGCGGVLNATGSMNSLNTDFGQGASGTGSASASEVAERLANSLPSWYEPVSITLTILLALSALVVIILLALPAAHPYFRKDPEVWIPPMAWPGGQVPPTTDPGSQPYGGYPPPPPPPMQ
jgi:hypothetical protein